MAKTSITQNVAVEGLRELDKALSELPKSIAKNVLKRVAIKALQPMRDAARANAPVRTGDLRESINISTKLSKRQAQLARRAFRMGGDKSFVELYAGPSALPHAHLQEFGSIRNRPQPFMRPAWDETKGQALKIVKSELWGEISKAAARVAKKKAKLAAKGR